MYTFPVASTPMSIGEPNSASDSCPSHAEPVHSTRPCGAAGTRRSALTRDSPATDPRTIVNPTARVGGSARGGRDAIAEPVAVMAVEVPIAV